MKYFLYILRSKVKETYYTGVSDDPERRHFFHNNDSKKGYTKRFRPWDLVFTKAFDTKEQALAAERKVKSWKSKRMIRSFASIFQLALRCRSIWCL